MAYSTHHLHFVNSKKSQTGSEDAARCLKRPSCGPLANGGKVMQSHSSSQTRAATTAARSEAFYRIKEVNYMHAQTLLWWVGNDAIQTVRDVPEAKAIILSGFPRATFGREKDESGYLPGALGLVGPGSKVIIASTRRGRGRGAAVHQSDGRPMGVWQMLEKMAGLTDPEAVRDSSILALLFDLGLHVEEISALNVDDYDPKRRTLRVRGMEGRRVAMILLDSGLPGGSDN
jgi:integrase